MTKNNRLLAAWNCEVAELLTSIDDATRLPAAMVRAIRALIPSELGFVVSHEGKGMPRTLYVYPEDYEEPVPYPDGLFALDPLYPAFKEGRTGSLSLFETMPVGFENTVYFQHYYGPYADQLLHLTRLPGGGTIAIGLVRTTEQGTFTKAERELHTAAVPVIEVCSVHLAKLLSDSGEPLASQASVDLDEALHSFGADLLTARELEVIHLVLRGHSTRSVASQLEIAADTVKLHRKHAYAKLRVSSQGELFFQFLESLGLGQDQQGQSVQLSQ